MAAVSRDCERVAKQSTRKERQLKKVLLKHAPSPLPAASSVNITKHCRHASTMGRGSVCPQVTCKKKKLLLSFSFFPPHLLFIFSPLSANSWRKVFFLSSPHPATQPARSDARSRTANKTEPSLQTANAHFSILGESLSVCSSPHISRMEPPDTGLCQLD